MSDESVFWEVTPDNEVIFPCYENLVFSEYWWTFLNDPSKEMLVGGGRGAAKTFTVVFKEVVRAFEHYSLMQITGAKVRPVGPAYVLYIICPTTESYQPIISYLDAMVPQVPGTTPSGQPNFHRVNSNGKSTYTIFGRRGIQIRVFSGYDADTLRGKGADSVVLDEAFLLKRDDVESCIMPISNRQGGYLGYFTALGSPDTEKCKEPWFDRACDEADPNLPEIRGYFSSFTLYSPTWLNNPDISDELYAKILKERELHEQKYLRERMGVRNLIIQAEIGGVGNVWSIESLTPCYYLEKVTVTSMANLLIGIDLAYGGEDSLCRAIIDKATCSLIDMTIIDPPKKDVKPSMEEAIKQALAFILDTARAYPLATITYDKGGRLGQSLPALVPAHLAHRVKAIDRTNAVKNRQVETLAARMTELDDKGKCQALRLPALESTWLTETQRANFKRLYYDMVNYWCEQKTDRFGKVTGVRYTKKLAGDDTIDGVVIASDGLPPIRREGQIKKSLTQIRRGAGRRAA